MCDIVCALAPSTVAGRTIVAKNSDRPPTEAQAVEWFAPRPSSATQATHITIPGPVAATTIGFIGSRPTWAWGVEHGVNEAGVAAGNEAIYTTADPRPTAPGLPGIDLVRLCLERARTAAEGVDVITHLIEAYGQGGSGHDGSDRPYWSSFLVADPDAAFVVETSGREWAVEPVSATRALSNRTTIPAFDTAHRRPRQPVATLVDPRLDASRAVLDRSALSVAAAEAHLRDHVGGDDGWTVCMHVEGVEATTAAMVTELPTDTSPIARFLLGSPCRSAFVPLVVGDPFDGAPAWHRFQDLSDGTVGRLRAVESSLEDALAQEGPSPGWNDRAWADVAAALDGSPLA